MTPKTGAEVETSHKAVQALAVGTLGVSIAALIAALLAKPAAAAPGPGPGVVIVDGDVRKALAALILNGQDIASLLATANETLTAILNALTGAAGERILEPFQEVNKTLTSGDNFPLYESKPGKGALIWAVVDVSSPNTTVQFKFDDLVWEFNFTTLFNEGMDRPIFPGVWLAKYDAVNSHYVLVFSAGDVKGWTWSRMAHILVRYTGSGTATLTEGRGVVWTSV